MLTQAKVIPEHGVHLLVTPADAAIMREDPRLADLMRRYFESIESTNAHADTIAEAQAQYASDEIEIDPYPPISEGDGGAWVAAWLWVESESDDVED